MTRILYVVEKIAINNRRCMLKNKDSMIIDLSQKSQPRNACPSSYFKREADVIII